MARGAPGASVGTGTATLLDAVAGDCVACGFVAPDLPPAAGLGAGVGHVAAADFAGACRAAVFFATGAAARPPLAGRAFLLGAAFLVGAALRTGALLVDVFFGATGLLVIVGFFFAAAGLLFTGARRAAGLAVGRARRAFAAGFFEVFLTAGFFTGSPRHGAATFFRKARREGAAHFGRGGL